MALLIDRIGELVTNDPTLGDGPLGLIRGAAVLVEADRVVRAGPREQIGGDAADECLDVHGRAVLPGFVETHAHLVFAGDRADEFSARMAGRPYETGGIRSTIARTRAATDAELTANLTRLVTEYRTQGTTTVECKSGYGQSVAEEDRAVRLARRHTPEVTLLAAHVVPPEYAGRPDDYVELVVAEMIPRCAPNARWIDAFCEEGAFDADQTRAVLAAGRAAGLGVRLHANQLTHGPGIRLAVELGAASVDHVCHVDDADVDALAASDTVATLLPAADFSARTPYPDARRLLDAGVTVALGADCNPGTAYTTSLPFCIALAVRELRMTTAEAVWARHRRGCAGAAAYRHRGDHARSAGRRDRARRTVPCAPGVPSRGPADLGRVAGRCPPWPPLTFRSDRHDRGPAGQMAPGRIMPGGIR